MKLTKFFVEGDYLYGSAEYMDGEHLMTVERSVKIPLVEFTETYQITMSKEFLHDFVQRMNESLVGAK